MKTFLLAGLIASGCLFSPFAKVVFAAAIEHQVEKENKRGYEQIKHKFVFNNGGPVSYQLNYHIIEDPAYLDFLPDAKLPSIGDPTAGSIGLGLNHAWYHNGFIRLNIDGHPLTAKALISTFHNEKAAGLYLAWPEKPGEVALTIQKESFSDNLMLEVKRAAMGKGERLSITFLMRPGNSEGRNLRWLTSGTQHHSLKQGDDPLVLDAKACWLLAYDVENNNPLGSAALLFDPQHFESLIEINNPSSICWVTLHLREGRESGRVRLWSFPERYMEPEAAYDYLCEQQEAILHELRRASFDTSAMERNVRLVTGSGMQCCRIALTAELKSKSKKCSIHGLLGTSLTRRPEAGRCSARRR